MAGYSDTPLLKKLGFDPSKRSYVDQAAPYFDTIRSTIQTADIYDFVHIFVKNRAELEAMLTDMKSQLARDGMLWVSWPKKTSRVITDINENDVRGYGLSSGLVDVKVAAIDEVWSGLKFVYRLKDR